MAALDGIVGFIAGISQGPREPSHRCFLLDLPVAGFLTSKTRYFSTSVEIHVRARSSVRIEHRTSNPMAGGSNPLAPETNEVIEDAGRFELGKEVSEANELTKVQIPPRMETGGFHARQASPDERPLFTPSGSPSALRRIRDPASVASRRSATHLSVAKTRGKLPRHSLTLLTSRAQLRSDGDSWSPKSPSHLKGPTVSEGLGARLHGCILSSLRLLQTVS